MFQSIKLNGELFNIFFDTGCSDFLTTKDAVDRLGKNATLLSKIPVVVSGVGELRQNLIMECTASFCRSAMETQLLK